MMISAQSNNDVATLMIENKKLRDALIAAEHFINHQVKTYAPGSGGTILAWIKRVLTK